MAKITIPEKHRAGVALIAALNSESVQEIKKALDRVLAQKTLDEGATPEKSIEESVSTLAKAIPNLTGPDLRKITETLSSLYTVKSAREMALGDFVAAISEAAESVGIGEAKAGPERKRQLEDNLAVLLNSDLFSFAAKVVDLKTDDERVFCHARILTDLRPVFGPRIEDGPQGMVVVHLLKLGYHTANKQHPEFFISLDSDDLRTLRGLIDRAEAKAKSLRSHLGNTRLIGAGKD